ncbi:MAG: Fe-Mn family superoxide dismutase [Cryomorphaceae bacterium]|jgi:Fe-Mn family superoxide dismutase
MSFQLPDLPYAFDALEPHIDARTMEIHHDKHHAGYTSKLNAALEGTENADKSIEELLANVDSLGAGIRNNGGGFYNHSLFWKVMGPDGGGNPSGSLASAIDSDLGGVDKLKEAFNNAAATQFGSGWAWVIVGANGKLHVTSTPNQDNNLMPGAGAMGTPILGLDVWEHAYYLNYQNRRPDYISAFWNVINWKQVAENYDALKG